MAIDFKRDLNPEQYAAVTSDAQHLRIIAGAGTGKTRTLTYRLAYMLTRGDMLPNQIVAITFTNKAAQEMRDRTDKILSENGLDIQGRPLISTFHSFCYRFLRKELVDHFKGFTKNFQVASEDDQKALFKKAAANIKAQADSKSFKEAVSIIEDYKTKGIEYNELKDNDNRSLMLGIDIKKLYEQYQILLASSDLLDFDDLLIFCRDVMVHDDSCRESYRRKYRAFLVDEFQDTNDLQYQIVKLFMSKDCELCVVGDPDQTIYTWRGADNSIIKSNLQRDFPDLSTITLDINYRSTQNILDKANTLIKNNHNRVDKSLKAVTQDKGEEVDFISSFESKEEAQTIGLRIKNLHEKNKVAYKDIAIIYRSNFQSRNFEQVFPEMRIPYRLFDATSFYDRIEVKAGLAYLRLLINTEDSVSFEKVIQYPSRKIGDVTLGNLYEQANAAQMPLFTFILKKIDVLQATPLVKTSLRSLIDSYNKCLQQLSEASSPKAMADAIDLYFENTGLYDCIREMDKKDSQKRDTDNENEREKNLQELTVDFKEFLERAESGKEEDVQPTLIDFLINVSLITAQDDNSDADAVNIMTGHVSKGLEFTAVFVTGMVSGVFPTTHAFERGREAMEEERRLFYVAMTRAKKYLCISTYGGTIYGNNPALPSPFLKEIGFFPTNDRSGFLYSSRRDSHSFASRARYENSRFNSDSTFRQIDRTAASHGYVPDENDYGTTTGMPSDYGNAKVTLSNVKRTGVETGLNDVEYKPGDKVAHASFGLGVVKEVNGNKLTVVFGPEIGTKVLIIGFKAFRKVG